MNAARLSKSDRLQRVLRLLKDRKWYSTRAIIRKAHVCAVNSMERSWTTATPPA